MNRKIIISLFISTIFHCFLYAQTITTSDGDFELYSNGIIKCTNASVGDTGTLNGVTYTKRSEAEILGGSLNETELEQSCISGVTSLANLFRLGHSSGVYPGLTPDISTWDVSSVISLFSMFRSGNFAPNIDNWDVGNVISMASLFRDNSADFSTLSLSIWDVSKVTQMNHMFKGTNFNGNISTWDVAAVFTFGQMFNGNTVFNQDISSWNVSNAESMDNMLNNTPLNVDLSGWCVSQFSAAEDGFASSTNLSEANKPNWGTCPTSRRKLKGDAGWRLISIPYDEPSLSDISDDIAIQGVTGGNNPGNDANVFTYDETGSFEVPSSMTTNLSNGTGLAIYVFDNDLNGSTSLPLDLDAQGTLITSDVNLNINSGAANLYTLVGNPFTTNFETDSIRAVGGEIQANVAFWSNELGSYTAFDRTTDGYIIPSWQAFWIETSDASVHSIILPAGGKKQRRRANAFFSKVVADSSSDNYWSNVDSTQKSYADLYFELYSKSTIDKAIRLSLRESAEYGYDRYDFGKLNPLLPEYATLSFLSDDVLKAVESLPYHLDKPVRVPLVLNNVSSENNFTLSWNGLDSFPSTYQIQFQDMSTGQNINLREQNEYIFTYESNSRSKNDPIKALKGPALKWKAKTHQDFRFWIQISPTGLSNELEPILEYTLFSNYPNPFNPSTQISFSIPESQHVKLSVYNTLGQVVAELVNDIKSKGQHTVQFDAQGLSSGVYLYRISTPSFTKTKKMMLIK